MICQFLSVIAIVPAPSELTQVISLGQPVAREHKAEHLAIDMKKGLIISLAFSPPKQKVGHSTDNFLT